MRRQVLGVISDTHGLLRPEVFNAFKSVELILHAGDIGKPDVLDGLRRIAPVIAVRGNNDRGAWARRIPDFQTVQIGRIHIYMLHNAKELKLEPKSKDFHAVVSGHSHQPRIDRRDGILFLNPGSAGPRRFKLPVSVARLIVDGSEVHADLIELGNLMMACK